MKSKRASLSLRMIVFAVLFLLAAAGSVVAQMQSTDDVSLLPPEKRDLVQQEEATRVAVLTAVPPAPRDATPPPAGPRPTLSLGIKETGLAPFPSQIYTINNHWNGRIAGNNFVVYAGALTQDPMQGILIVDIMDGDMRRLPASGNFLTPEKSGPVRVVEAKGQLLTVSSITSQRRFVFEVVTRLFTTAR